MPEAAAPPAPPVSAVPLPALPPFAPTTTADWLIAPQLEVELQK